MMRIFLATLSLLVTACAASRGATLKRMAGEMAGAEGKLKQKTVALFVPETRGMSHEAEALEVTDLLTHELVSGSNLRMVERSRLNQVLKEQELAQTGSVDPVTAARLGRLLGVDAVIIGVITGKPGRSEIFLRLVDSTTAEILKTAHGEIPREDAGPSTGRNPAAKTSSPLKTNTSTALKANERRHNVELKGSDSGALEAVAEPMGRLTDISFRKAGPGGFAQVIGRIENTGQATLGDPRLSLQLYDGKKNLVGGAPCLAPDRPVMAGEKLPFSCLFKPPALYASHELSYEPSGISYGHRAMALSATNVKFAKSPGSSLGDYSLSGILKNDEETTVTYPKILISLFDTSGKFIGSAYGFAVKKELKPGESSPFHVTVYGFSLHGKPARYEAFYSALLTNR